jgi:hypothetical protein
MTAGAGESLRVLLVASPLLWAASARVEFKSAQRQDVTGSGLAVTERHAFAYIIYTVCTELTSAALNHPMELMQQQQPHPRSTVLRASSAWNGGGPNSMSSVKQGGAGN